MNGRHVLLTVCFVALGGLLGVAAQESVRPLLDAIRTDLVELRFEKALAGIDALLGQPDLGEVERGEALVLRSQAHVAFGDLAAAERDYREILRLRPAYVPDSMLTPSKAMKRFEKIRADTIGYLIVRVEPADAQLTLDGREVESMPGDGVPLFAGEHLLLIRRDGFDPLEQVLTIDAGQDVLQEIRMVPNARTVVVRTEPAGVDVYLDGVRVGKTARPEDNPYRRGLDAAELRLEALSLGEHEFELRKACFRSERRRDMVTVDLFDFSPKFYAVVDLVPVSSTLVFRGGPASGSVIVDDVRVGRLPLDPIEVCPGSHRFEVRFESRPVWRSDAVLEESEERVVEIVSRPNVVLYGTDEWPPELGGMRDSFNATTGLPLRRGVDLSDPASWARLDLPPDTDLALAPGPGSGDGATRDWYVYSPVLRAAHEIDLERGAPERPVWAGVSWGLFTVDSVVGGPAIVAEVAAGGSAAEAGIRPGDRIVTLGGTKVSGSAQVQRILDIASINAPLEIEWSSGGAVVRKGRIQGTSTPRLPVVPEDPLQRSVRAAWAVVDSICDVEWAPIALANLAMLLSSGGSHGAAAETWEGVSLPDRAGIGAGTVRYYLGKELQELGRTAEAREAHREAAASSATAFDDEGPGIAPAARDRLADLGVVAGTNAP